MFGLDEGAGVRVRSVCCSCICVVEGQRIHALFPQIASLMNGFERHVTDGNGLGWKLLGPSLMFYHEEIERELVISGFD